ncbi:50S ribosomal protein L23 [Hymenobacter coalescens]|jgi:large subunit ribosomal protein L23|uniref:Large ribosomal subunit protein uL23 n=2 Tax=Hymenobacter TaxID=89966 RepID=A0A328BJD7_9BACT|nr:MULTISPECIES: 50S ribosomal protein L23 [Hymenobacter]MCC3157743.1 50S ribosomal protein L23 [Hymenobacter sp. 15J16-1T3B]OON68075.1 50S ribosomal protein L23 [Hymenobacter sp. CRA2]RAK66765.1 50S ribosomal protein L23 [Hymenobacter edaphi]TLM90465.1 50S ribosomal protein L23 [Hymenobacter jeollabukensis]
MSIIKKPIVTEKATSLNEKGQYAFEVERTANKVEIKKEIEKLYGVTVVGISTIRSQGKLKSRFTKTGAVTGRRASSKKAIVTVKEGEVIDFYSGI